MTGDNWARIAVALACMWVGGYATGRGRPVRELVAWADWQVSYRPRTAPQFWLAVPIIAAAVAALWITHPRRTAANWRSWQHDKH
ncbi:hypothetical protein ABZT26_03020 [Streptomyces sp. NPDC005395]|uniref:hypothetical protein n=1 Tax=unclassified Streptomyces TaxID=2593676 RepID=UPI001F1BBA3E|nr:hypothetical protein [Streptomyces sp. BSE6.1]